MKTTTAAKSITVRNIQAKTRKLHGHTHEGETLQGHHACIEPKSRIVLWGVNRNYRGPNGERIKAYRSEFKVGDVAIYDAWNLTYFGRITAIGAKTVTIAEDDGRLHRLDLWHFHHYNAGRDFEALVQRNLEWMD